MVRLALGEPDRYAVRQDQDGSSAIWHYVTYDTPAGPLYRGWYHDAVTAGPSVSDGGCNDP